jgi:hypothetical protein
LLDIALVSFVPPEPSRVQIFPFLFLPLIFQVTISTYLGFIFWCLGFWFYCSVGDSWERMVDRRGAHGCLTQNEVCYDSRLLCVRIGDVVEGKDAFTLIGHFCFFVLSFVNFVPFVSSLLACIQAHISGLPLLLYSLLRRFRSVVSLFNTFVEEIGFGKIMRFFISGSVRTLTYPRYCRALYRLINGCCEFTFPIYHPSVVVVLPSPSL